jgi:TetR/AcrR family transcriptional regulator, transcriptional repressor for nem operon
MSTEPRTRPGRATRARIVQAATDLVAERGAADTSLDDVRERAHASKSQLYLYFDDRDALMRAVAQATCEAVLDHQADALAEFDSLAGIERYLDMTVANQIQRQARGCPIGSLVPQLAERDDDARLELADGYARWEQGLREGLERMAARGDLRNDADPSQLAKQTLALLQGGLLLTKVRRDPGELRTAVDAALALVRAAMVSRGRTVRARSRVDSAGVGGDVPQES